MAVTGTITAAGAISGEPEGSSTINLSWAITAGASDATVYTTETGDNTVTVPSGTTLVVIVPPTANTATIKLKGAGGDTGVQINKTKPTILCWDTGASFILNFSAATSGLKVRFV